MNCDNIHLLWVKLGAAFMPYWNFEYTKDVIPKPVMVGQLAQTFVSRATNVTHLPSSSFFRTRFDLPTLLQLLANLIDLFTQ